MEGSDLVVADSDLLVHVEGSDNLGESEVVERPVHSLPTNKPCIVDKFSVPHRGVLHSRMGKFRRAALHRQRLKRRRRWSSSSSWPMLKIHCRPLLAPRKPAARLPPQICLSSLLPLWRCPPRSLSCTPRPWCCPPPTQSPRLTLTNKRHLSLGTALLDPLTSRVLMQVFPDAFPNSLLLRPCTLTSAPNNDQREVHKFSLLLSAEFWASSCPRVPPQSQVDQRRVCSQAHT